MATPTTMTAAIQYAYGGPEVLQVVHDVPVPTYSDTQVLIKVYASTVSGLDPLFRKGKMRFVPVVGTSLPYIPGMEVSGVVQAVGKKVKRFKEGDEVFALGTVTGSCAQYCVCTEDKLAKKPPNITHLQAAALPGCIVTAHKTLVEYGKVRHGSRVLIMGAAGASGTIITQWTKHMGCFVVGVCSTSNIDWVREVGADLVIDYTKQKYIDVLPNLEDKVDYVIDCINVWDPTKTTGKSPMEQAYKVLKPDGDYIALTSTNFLAVFGAKLGLSRPFTRVGFGGIAGEKLEELGHKYTNNEIKPLDIEVQPLSEIQEIHRRVDAHKFRCKIVVQIPHE